MHHAFSLCIKNKELTSDNDTMSLSPFDIKGKGWIKNQHTLPLFTSCGRSVLQIWCIPKWPSSSWVHAKFSNIFFNEVHDSVTKDSYLHQLSIQVYLHMRLNYPTKWVYTLQLRYPTKWVYKNDKSLHDWILQIYIMGLNKTFSTNYKNDHLRPTPEGPQAWEHISEPS